MTATAGLGCQIVFFHNKSCIGWFEAVRGRLIDLKTWDRIVGIFLRFFLLALTVQKISGLFVWQ